MTRSTRSITLDDDDWDEADQEGALRAARTTSSLFESFCVAAYEARKAAYVDYCNRLDQTDDPIDFDEFYPADFDEFYPADFEDTDEFDIPRRQ